ncbi:recombinase family protein [Streptomyces sp. NPDC013099]|uniref:recombinase family protein n=1 Tax=Streptomyces sp. NPDC013099 TaxID=3156687 RepID=UPI0033E96398
MKRLGRDAAELTALADHLTAHGLVLEMLAGPLPGIYDPTGPGKLLFAFFAAMAETERENIRESTLEGLDTAARKGKHGGRPPVITDDMLHTVLRRRANGESVEQIQPDLIIPTGKRKGQSPSVASIYRALAEHEKRVAYPEAVEQAHADFAALQTVGSIPGQMAGSCPVLRHLVAVPGDVVQFAVRPGADCLSPCTHRNRCPTVSCRSLLSVPLRIRSQGRLGS